MKKRELSVGPYRWYNKRTAAALARGCTALYQKQSDKASALQVEEAGATAILVAFRAERGSILTTAPKTSTSRADSTHSKNKTSQKQQQWPTRSPWTPPMGARRE